jgi:hypothetical protein
MWTKKGKSALTNGDQPGVALGVVSNKIMGMVAILMSSTDVEAEGGGCGADRRQVEREQLKWRFRLQRCSCRRAEDWPPRALKDVLCAAFRAAVDEHCAKPKGKRGKFNNKFYNHLNRLDPKLAGEDLPGGARHLRRAPQGPRASWLRISRTPREWRARPPMPSWRSTRRACAPSPARGRRPSPGPPSNAAIPGGPWGVAGIVALGFGSIGKATVALWNGVKGGVAPRIRVKFPDGLIGKQVIEIKGPGDTMKPSQAKAYSAFSKPDPPIVPSCDSCAPAQLRQQKDVQRRLQVTR